MSTEVLNKYITHTPHWLSKKPQNQRQAASGKQMALELQLFMFMEALAANCQGKVLGIVGLVIGKSV